MHEDSYPLKDILNTFTSYKGSVAKRRLIYDQSRVGGISSKWVIAFFFSLPIMLYAGIFNPIMFEMLGIAQAIIFFIVFLSMVMILIVAMVFINNNKVIRQIQPSWDTYFPQSDLTWVLATGRSMYKDFFQHYSKALDNKLEGKALENLLKEAFAQMQEENKALYDAVTRDKNTEKRK